MILLKVAKNQGVTLTLEDTLSEKPQHGWRRGGETGPQYHRPTQTQLY